jgi:hypothetical protein
MSIGTFANDVKVYKGKGTQEAQEAQRAAGTRLLLVPFVIFVFLSF